MHNETVVSAKKKNKEGKIDGMSQRKKESGTASLRRWQFTRNWEPFREPVLWLSGDWVFQSPIKINNLLIVPKGTINTCNMCQSNQISLSNVFAITQTHFIHSAYICQLNHTKTHT